MDVWHVEYTGEEKMLLKNPCSSRHKDQGNHFFRGDWREGAWWYDNDELVEGALINHTRKRSNFFF